MWAIFMCYVSVDSTITSQAQNLDVGKHHNAVLQELKHEMQTQ